MKIDFCIAVRGWLWVDVSGEIVDIAPHLAHVLTPVVHRTLSGNQWCLSALETGQAIGSWWPTRRRALSEATAKLARETPESILAAYRSASAYVRL